MAATIQTITDTTLVKDSLAILLQNDQAAVDAANSAVATATQAATDAADAKAIAGSKASLISVLGFTPIQQGTGVGQSTNAVKIGWKTGSLLGLTVDATDLGNFVLDSRANNFTNTNNFSGTTNFAGDTTFGGASVKIDSPLTVTKDSTFSGVNTFTGASGIIAQFGAGGGNAYRLHNGTYGTFWRIDSGTLYLMVTASGDPLGNWTSARPIQMNLSTGILGINGNAATATKLANPRTLQTNLGSTATASFDGSANVSPGVTGTLPITNGGTGGVTAAAARENLQIDLLSGRNMLINGAFIWNSWGDYTAQSGSTQRFGGADRFLLVAESNGQITQSRSTMIFDGGSYFSLKQTVPTGKANTDFSGTKYVSGFVQFLEGYSVLHSVGKPTVLSFMFQASQVGTYTIRVSYLFQEGTKYVNRNFAITQANTPTYVEIPLPASPSGTFSSLSGHCANVMIGAVSQGTLAASISNSSGWGSDNFVSDSSAVLWPSTVGASIMMAKPQWEIGVRATPFEIEDLSLTRTKISRYVQFYNIRISGAVTYAPNGDTRWDMPLTTPMRIDGAVVSWGGTPLAVGVSDGGSFANVNVPITQMSASSGTLRLTGVNAGNMTSYGAVAVWGASNSISIIINGEI